MQIIEIIGIMQIIHIIVIIAIINIIVILQIISIIAIMQIISIIAIIAIILNILIILIIPIVVIILNIATFPSDIRSLGPLRTRSKKYVATKPGLQPTEAVKDVLNHLSKWILCQKCSFYFRINGCKFWIGS